MRSSSWSRAARCVAPLHPSSRTAPPPRTQALPPVIEKLPN
ncbi:MAG: hypothetical protein QME96_01150 [Myxococcota bacterium]|nr:hypothetical protein [Myxococcota bacterium]